MKKIRLFNIVWDTDGERIDIPTSAEFDVKEDVDVSLEGADLLSDKFGWCVESFDFEILTPTPGTAPAEILANFGWCANFEGEHKMASYSTQTIAVSIRFSRGCVSHGSGQYDSKTQTVIFGEDLEHIITRFPGEYVVSAIAIINDKDVPLINSSGNWIVASNDHLDQVIPKTESSELDQVKSERDALAKAIGDFVVAVGIARPVPMTGPELLHMLQSAQDFLAPTPGPAPADILAELVESICKDKQGKVFIPESEYPVIAKATAYVETLGIQTPRPQDAEHDGTKFNDQFFVNCASEHGLNSDDPDHEVGDLQEFFRLSWSLLTTQQRVMFARNPTVLGLVECSDQRKFDVLEAYQEVNQ